jgi:uncharacterized protein (TIGR02147 family)
MNAAKKLALKPDIFSYHDYRAYLLELFEYMKCHQSQFSLRSLARAVGVSGSYFTMVLREGAPLSSKVLALLTKPLSLTHEEHSYLSHLVALCDAKSLEEQTRAFQKLSRFGLYKSRHQEGILAHRYFSNWYYVAIRELANRSDFNPDPKWINQHLEKKLPATTVREATSFLIEHGFISKTAEGRYQAAEHNVTCEGSVYRLALTEFYRQTYQMCVDSIFQVPREERYLTSHSMAVTDEGFVAVQKILQDTIGKLQAVTVLENKKPQLKRVYHISLASIPFSKKPEKPI